MIQNCRQVIEDQKADLECFGVYEGMEIQL
jgi:hypothetical protein